MTPDEKRKILGKLLSENDKVTVAIKNPSACILPPRLREGGHLSLEIGYSMPIPIPDLDLGEAAWSGTLSFNQSPFWVCIPWSSVFAFVLPGGHGVRIDSDPEPVPSKGAKVISLCDYRKRKGLTQRKN